MPRSPLEDVGDRHRRCKLTVDSWRPYPINDSIVGYVRSALIDKLKKRQRGSDRVPRLQHRSAVDSDAVHGTSRTVQESPHALHLMLIKQNVLFRRYAASVGCWLSSFRLTRSLFE